MGILQSDKVIFYHPCNDETEFTQTADWAETTPTYPAGKVSNALAGTGGDPSFGSEAEFNPAVTNYMDTAALSSTKFIVAYTDNGDSNRGKAAIGTVSGTDVTFGAEQQFLSTEAFGIGVAKLTETSAILVYCDQVDSRHGTAKVCTISGTGITFGPEKEYLSGYDSVENRVAALTSSTFVIVYKDGTDSNQGKARIGTVSGTDITFGGAATLGSGGQCEEYSIAVLSSSKFVVSYIDNNDSGHGTCMAGAVAGTAISFGAEKEFTTSSCYGSAVGMLDASTFVVVWCDTSGGTTSHARIGTVAGTDISVGASVQWLGNQTHFFSIGYMSSTKFILAYRDYGDSGHGTTRIGTVSGNDITFGSEVEFNASTTSYITVPMLSTSSFAVVYKDHGDSDHGTAKAGTASAAATIEHQSGMTLGTSNEFLSAGSASGYSCDSLDSTRFILIWSANTAGKGQATIATVSGTAVTFGAVVDFWSSQPSGDNLGVASLSATSAVVVWKKGTGQGVGVAATISGTDITFGAEAQFVALCGLPRVTSLDSTRCVVVYEDNSASRTRAKVGTVSGADLTWGAVSGDLVSGAQAGSQTLAPLSSTAFAVSYNDGGDSNHGYCKIGTVSGDDITWGTGAKFVASMPTYAPLRLAAMSATKFVVAWTHSSSGRARVASVAGTDITYGAEHVFLSGSDAGDITMAGLSSTHVAIAYRDDGDSQDGKVKIGTVSGADVTFGAETEFQAGGVSRIDIARLADNKFGVIYGNGADSYNGYAVVGEFSSITYPTVVSETKVAFCGWLKKPSG